MTLLPSPSAFATAEEARLWGKLKAGGDVAAREKLFNLYHGYAQEVARRRFLDRRSGDIELGDLSQLAFAGLLEAIDGFDPERGIPFKGFAHRRIVGSILDGVAKASELREQISYRNRLKRERVKSLAAEVEGVERLSADDALNALVEVAVGLAIGFMLDDTNLVRSEAKAERAPNAYETLAWKETVQAALRCLSELPAKERSIIEHHYIRGLRFDELTAVLGLSKGRISQLHRSALLLLRQRLTAEHHFSLER
jgi:RNA polymerase sigma factor for flagellar operon FliA